MNELRRREYLSSMGFEVYYPRFKLPGAKPSPQYQLPADSTLGEETAPGIKKDLKTTGNSLTAVSASLKKEARRPAIPPIRSTTEKPDSKPLQQLKPDVPVAQIRPSDSGEELRFSLQYFAINESLAVLNEAPHQLRGKQSRDSINLLQAILQALLPAQELPPLDPSPFHWPIAEGLSAPDPKRAAFLALQGFINQRCKQDGFTNILVFTAQIQDLFWAKGSEESFGDQTQSALNCQLTLTHSLQSMLVHPLLKREVWTHIQPLRKRLNSK